MEGRGSSGNTNIYIPFVIEAHISYSFLINGCGPGLSRGVGSGLILWRDIPVTWQLLFQPFRGCLKRSSNSGGRHGVGYGGHIGGRIGGCIGGCIGGRMGSRSIGWVLLNPCTHREQGDGKSERENVREEDFLEPWQKPWQAPSAERQKHERAEKVKTAPAAKEVLDRVHKRHFSGRVTRALIARSHLLQVAAVIRALEGVIEDAVEVAVDLKLAGGLLVIDEDERVALLDAKSIACLRQYFLLGGAGARGVGADVVVVGVFTIVELAKHQNLPQTERAYVNDRACVQSV